MSTTEGTERLSEDGAREVKVNTVDYRSPAGDDQDQEAKKENVEIIHVQRKDDKGGTNAGVMAQTAAKVAEKIQSAKEAISGTHDQTTRADQKSKGNQHT